MSRTKKTKAQPTSGGSETATLHQRTLFEAFSDGEGLSELVILLKQMIAMLIERVGNLEKQLVEALNRLMGGVPFEEKDFYTTKEFAKIANLKVATVQDYLRQNRIQGIRTESGRGGIGEWRITKEEVVRYQNEGLRQPEYRYRHPR